MFSQTSTSEAWQPALHRLGRFFSNARAGLPFVNTSTTASNNGGAAGISSLPLRTSPLSLPQRSSTSTESRQNSPPTTQRRNGSRNVCWSTRGWSFVLCAVGSMIATHVGIQLSSIRPKRRRGNGREDGCIRGRSQQRSSKRVGSRHRHAEDGIP